MKKLLVLVVFLAALPSYAADTTLTQTGAQVQSAITAAANSAAVTGVVSGAGDGTYSAKAIGTSSGQIAAGDHTHATLHTQNTDTGTTSATFQLDSGNTGPKIKNNSGVVEAKNSADNAYVGVKALSYDTAKTSGTAGRAGVYEANSTSTYQIGWEGPANHGSDLWFKYSNDSPSAGQAMAFGAPSTGVSQITWYDPVKYGTAGTGNIITTGIVAGKVGVISKTDDYTLGTDAASEAYGYVVFMSGSGKTLTLPAVAIGMSVCLYSTDANAKNVDPNNSDGIRNGTANRNADGHKITSGGNAGDYVCLVGDSADGWTVLGKAGIWTDE